MRTYPIENTRFDFVNNEETKKYIENNPTFANPIHEASEREEDISYLDARTQFIKSFLKTVVKTPYY